MNSTFTFKSFVVDMSSSTATDTTAPSVPASSTSPAWSGSQIAFAILGARDFGAAIVGGLGAKFVLGLSNQESVRFAGICALSHSKVLLSICHHLLQLTLLLLPFLLLRLRLHGQVVRLPLPFLVLATLEPPLSEDSEQSSFSDSPIKNPFDLPVSVPYQTYDMEHP
jgi:hypothetical protein